MKVIVCGGRDFTDYQFLHDTLKTVQLSRGKFTLIVHGNAKGADTLADFYGGRNHIATKRYIAEWKKYGLGAGPIRNMQMLREEKPDLVIAFKGGAGTADMIRQAKMVGVEVIDCAASR